jgi:hypothetical protein
MENPWQHEELNFKSCSDENNAAENYARSCMRRAFTRISIMLQTFLLLLLLGGMSSGAERATPALYQPVLQHIRYEYQQPLVLYDAPLRTECLRGRCDEPWAGPLPNAWLQKMKSAGVIAEFCTYQHGLCVGPAGEPAQRPGGIYITLTTPSSCGEKCAEVHATLVLPGGDRSAIRRYMRYHLRDQGGIWSLVSATHLADGYMDG